MGYDQHCPSFEKAREILGKKWTGLILRTLLSEPKRFGEIRDRVTELSDRVLSERLNELEREGVVIRRVHADKPVVIEYGLSPKGESLRPVVDAIQAWSEIWCKVEPASVRKGDGANPISRGC